MALTSVFYDGVVTEGDRAKNRGGVPDYGVYGADDFKVTAHPSIPYAVLVKAGRAHGHGVTDTAATDQVVQCTTLATGVRWDIIVVRRNWQPLGGGPSTLVPVFAGATANIPNTLKANPGVEDDQPIYLVKWQGGTSAPVQFIDLRCWAGNGGMVAVDLLARNYLAKPGANVLIDSTTWRYIPGENSVWDWTSDQAATVAPLQVTGWAVTGPITIAPIGGKRQVTANLAINRTSADSASFGGPTFTSIGAVIPSIARYAGTLYDTAILSGAAVRGTLHAAVSATGAISFRAESGSISVPKGGNLYLNISYYI